MLYLSLPLVCSRMLNAGLRGRLAKVAGVERAEPWCECMSIWGSRQLVSFVSARWELSGVPGLVCRVAVGSVTE